MTPQDAIDRALALPIWTNPGNATALSGGITNHNIRLSDGGRDYVVRVGGDIPVHQVMRFNELTCHTAAHAAGLSPAVVHSEPGILAMDFVEGRTLTEAAIETARTTPADIVQADAIAWLRDALPQRRQDAATVLFHTVAWQYLPDAAKRAGDALIAEAGAKATAEAPLARVAMEARRDPDDPSSFLSRAVLSLTLWPGGVTLDLGTVDFHGRDMIWTGPVTHDPFLTRPAQ